MEDWPHQVFAVNEVAKAIKEGKRRICLTSPTGGGKSRIMQRIVEWGRPTVLITNRVMLLEQLALGLDKAGIYFGMQASGYAPSAFENVQVASIQTLYKRWRNGQTDLPEAEIVILDELHNETGQRACEILDEYEQRGATVIGVTATPVGIGHMADHLIIAGYTSDLRNCGALVPAYTYAPDEPDTRALKAQTRGIIQYRNEVKEVMLKVVFGRVIEHYHRLNPDQRPAVLFAPGVDESRWFCERFNAEGIPWSHIDSQTVIINGTEMAANKETRQLLRTASLTGKTKGVANRFVLREGVDWPHLYHGIFACTFGSVAAYIQAGGRLLRAHESLDHVCIARDTPILTDRGLVKIQDVKITDKVWDGIEFVQHGGAVCNGMRRVITWDGLTATPDHKVHTANGWESLAQASRGERRVTRSGIGRHKLRVSDNSDPHYSGPGTKSKGRSFVQSLQETIVHAISQIRLTCPSWVSPLHESIWFTCARVGIQAGSKAMASMQRPKKQLISILRSARHRIPLRVGVSGNLLDCCEHWGSRGSKSNYRSHRLKRPLRARQSAMGNCVRADKEQKSLCTKEFSLPSILVAVPRGRLFAALFRLSVQKRDDSRGNSGSLEATQEVWDIINAGPRHRFTAAGRLVGNCIQDHGGNFWRHDSLNCDREWSLTDTDRKIQDAHDEAYRSKEKSEPVVCPQCAMVRSRGARCPKCGFAYEGRRRMVIQTNGRLREVRGDIYKPRRQAEEVPELVKNWIRCVYRCKNSNRTFNQARALFQRENRGLVPADNYPMIPLRPSDWYEKVGRVPADRLTRKHADTVVHAGQQSKSP